MYDITNAKSFENINTWKSDFITKAGPRDPDNFPFFLFGNKADKASTDRKVSLDYIERWQRDNNDLGYEETSAIDGTNVEAAFNRVARDLLKMALI